MRILTFDESMPSEIFEGVVQVHKTVFEGADLKREKLIRKNLIALVAIQDGAIVGFKFGYEHPDGVFYSWLGGVDPAYQKQGIAKRLMDYQHSVVRDRGYQSIRTYSRNEKMAMLILNLKCGFFIQSTFVDDEGIHKIILEKRL